MKNSFLYCLAIWVIGVAGCVSNPPVPAVDVKPSFLPRSITAIGKDVFVIRDPLTVRFAGGLPPIVVPAGFITDLASIPKIFHFWEGKTDASMAPAIVHDYLYWYQPCTKDEADAVMYATMVSLGVGPFNSAAIFEVVSDYPFAYRSNTDQKARGQSRTLEPKYYENLRNRENFDPTRKLDEILLDAAGEKGLIKPEIAPPEVKTTCEAILQACTYCREFIASKSKSEQ